MEQEATPPELTNDAVSIWERLYRFVGVDQVPWNAGRPDPDLIRLVEAGTIPVGTALDIGAGAGHDAVFLAQKGFSVTAVEIAPTAVKLSAEKAAAAAVSDKVTFKTADITRVKLPEASFGLALDRGFFHYLRPADRQPYIDRIHGWLSPGGMLILRAFSDKEPPGIGPTRYPRAELESLFSPRFNFLEVSESLFLGPTPAKSHLCLLRRKP